MASRTAFWVSEKLPLEMDELLSSPFSPVRFQREISIISGKFPGFLRKKANFLGIVDCVAEREGFEPSIQVLARITV